MLDVHVAESLADVSHTDREFGIDLDLHSTFFGRPELTEGCPIIKRMKDFYADCCIAGRELTGLLNEIERIEVRIPANSPYQTMLRNLR